MHWLMALQTAGATAIEGAKAVAGGSTSGDVTEVVPYLTSGLMIMYAQRMLKGFGWYQNFVQAVPGADKWAHRVFAGSASAIAAAGIHLTFTGSLMTGGEIHGTYPNIFEMLHGLGDWVKVFAIQQWAYDSSRRPEEQVLHELRAIAIGNYVATQRATLPPTLPPPERNPRG
jgi:hypothetical protein